jgi:peptide/nickel transport system substrate-binding protein
MLETRIKLKFTKKIHKKTKRDKKMERKNLAITVLIVALLGSGIANIILVVVQPTSLPPELGVTYVRVTSSDPDTLELVDAWDQASNDVLEQVVETLFFYDLNDLSLPRVNLLAHSYWWEDSTTVHIKLREGIIFHDGTPFNAAAAKWNLDRLQYLTNNTGTNTGQIAHTQSLWRFPDGVTPIMDTITTVGDYNITITLNDPYAPFLNTLTYINSGMISPTAHVGDETSFIDLTTGDPIGTGPFTYNRFIPGVEVRLERWDNYWKAPANFPSVIFTIQSDVTTAHNSFLSYQVDENNMPADQNLGLYEADPKLTVYRFTEETGRPSLVYQYLGFNNQKYNKTWRQAMSYAINYTYVIDELRLGNAIRAVGAISPGYGAPYNASVEAIAPQYNLTKAREIMVSMGFGNMGWTDAQWIAVADSGSPFLSVPNTYNLGNAFREDMFVAVSIWFQLIGIDVVDDGVTFPQFLGYLFDDYDHLGVYAIGWGPDYLDPYNMLDPLFNPASGSNSAQVNDTWLNTKMASALSETDDNARNDIYKSIQWYMAARGFFHAPLYHSKVLTVHQSNIYGFPYNAMGSLRIYPIYRGLYPPFGV